MKSALLAILAFVPIFLRAQAGCTDPLATNFNPSASSNDGSCQYAVMNYAPVFKSALPNDLREISGFCMGNAKWWGHNDSGFSAEFFNINPSNGSILQKIKLDNAHNRDWEDMASEGSNLYIGDFGNNHDDRQNLGVYIVPFAEIGNSSSETVQEFEWSFLPFSYIDQTDFSTQPEDSTVFDCEAMIVLNGKIHLFTKSRRNYNTVHYVINPSNNAAEKVEEFNTEGLITGAAFSYDNQLIALVGYDLRPFIPTVFCWLLWDWQPGSELFFSGNKRRLELGSALQVGQVESIGFDTPRSGYLTNERTGFNGVTIVGESLWSFDFSNWVPLSVGAQEPAGHMEKIVAYPNPFKQLLRLQRVGNADFDFLRIRNPEGTVLLDVAKSPDSLDLSSLKAGVYSIEFWNAGRLLQTSEIVKQE